MVQADNREDHSRNDHRTGQNNDNRTGTMDNRTGPMDNRSLFKFDGSIPFTFVMGLGLMWATYSWSQVQDLKDRMAVREASSFEYRRKVDQLEVRQVEMQTFRTDLLVMKEIMNRIEKKLDAR